MLLYNLVQEGHGLYDGSLETMLGLKYFENINLSQSGGLSSSFAPSVPENTSMFELFPANDLGAVARCEARRTTSPTLYPSEGVYLCGSPTYR